LITICQNIIWDIYGCLIHFSMAINYENYSYHFGIPTFLIFVNFSIVEFKLLIMIFKNQNIRYYSDSLNFRRILLRLHVVIYLFIFVSIFFVLKFLFEKQYLFLAICLTWLPQIVYNVISKNRLSMPMINVILYTLNKLFLPVLTI